MKVMFCCNTQAFIADSIDEGFFGHWKLGTRKLLFDGLLRRHIALFLMPKWPIANAQSNLYWISYLFIYLNETLWYDAYWKTLNDYCLILLSLGKGCVYSFDPVGSYERETYRAGGSASALLQPLLDNQVCYTSYSVVSHRHVNDQALGNRGGSRVFLKGGGVCTTKEWCNWLVT